MHSPTAAAAAAAAVGVWQAVRSRARAGRGALRPHSAPGGGGDVRRAAVCARRASTRELRFAGTARWGGWSPAPCGRASCLTPRARPRTPRTGRCARRKRPRAASWAAGAGARDERRALGAGVQAHWRAARAPLLARDVLERVRCRGAASRAAHVCEHDPGRGAWCAGGRAGGRAGGELLGVDSRGGRVQRG